MKKILLPMVFSLVLAGCSGPNVFGDVQSGSGYGFGSSKKIKDDNLIKSSHKAADNLMDSASYLKSKLDPVVITSIADITDIDSSSALGLMISEQVGDRFAQHGFPVIDVRQRKDLKVRENTGEFMLSRDVQKISTQHAAGAVLVGTYAVGNNKIYVSTRLVRPADNRILAAHDFELPMGPNTKTLVNTKTVEFEN